MDARIKYMSSLAADKSKVFYPPFFLFIVFHLWPIKKTCPLLGRSLSLFVSGRHNEQHEKKTPRRSNKGNHVKKRIRLSRLGFCYYRKGYGGKQVSLYIVAYFFMPLGNGNWQLLPDYAKLIRKKEKCHDFKGACEGGDDAAAC